MASHVRNAGPISIPATRERPATGGGPRLLIQFGGFVIVAALLGLDAWVGLHGASAIRAELAQIDHRQVVNAAVINRLLLTQRQLTSIQNAIPDSAESASRAQPLAELDTIEQTVRRLFAELRSSDLPASDGNSSAWLHAETTAFALIAELRTILSVPARDTGYRTRLQSAYDDFSSATASLVESSHAGSESSRQLFEQSIERQSLEDRLLLAGCLIAACLFLWTATRTRRLLTAQSEELNRVSWQLLEKQENLARRLSRELHDELGQSLTALKTNLSRHTLSSCVNPSWMEDCSELLRESIRNAHEVSQLLRPTVLDDFGLDSALSWLCDRFRDRHDIEVSYLADFDGRLDDQTETHVFRIAQEALTNVARHSRATRVRVHFWRDGDSVSLEVADNGIGLPTGTESQNPSLRLNGFGITGMKARARTMRGTMQIVSSNGQGAAVRVTFPLRDKGDEKDPGSAG